MYLPNERVHALAKPLVGKTNQLHRCASIATRQQRDAPACLNPILTNALNALTGAAVGAHAGTDGLAGYATAARLEYLLLPVVFGLGVPMVALVGANIGAGQHRRARSIALTGGAMGFVLAELVGMVAALRPNAWLSLFGANEQMLQTGAIYLHYLSDRGRCARGRAQPDDRAREPAVRPYRLKA